jgi:hypothetical protein
LVADYLPSNLHLNLGAGDEGCWVQMIRNQYGAEIARLAAEIGSWLKMLAFGP